MIIFSKKDLLKVISLFTALLTFGWSVATAFYNQEPLTTRTLISSCSLAVVLTILLLILSDPCNLFLNHRRAKTRDLLLLLCMSLAFGLHFLAVQPFTIVARSYIFGLNATWFFFISDRIFHFKIAKLILPFITTAAVIGLLCLDQTPGFIEMFNAWFFVLVLTLLTATKQESSYIQSTTDFTTTSAAQYIIEKAPQKNAVIDKVLEKLPCGIIRFDENLNLLQSNHTARKLFGFQIQNEICNDEIYEAFSKITSLKIRKDLPDKELLCLWLEELANSLATPEKKQAKKSLSINAFSDSNSFHSLLKVDTIGDMKKKNDVVDYSYISLADFFNYLNMQSGMRLKELTEFTNQSHSEDSVVFDGKFKYDEFQPEKTIEFELFTIIDDGQAGKQLIITMKDMTVRDRVSVVENNSAFKDNLFGSMSHELRTPLNAILSSLDSSLKDSQTSIHVRDNYIVPALRSSKFLLSIVDDLLDYSKVQLNKLDLRYESFRVTETIESCIEIVQYNADKKGIDIRVVTHEPIPVKIRSDRSRFSQILLNLLSNAIKFTESEGQVKVIVEGSQDPVSYVKVSVEDTGIGMSLSDRQRLQKSLEVWELVDKTSANSSGAGIGLFISNQLALLLSPDESGLKIHSIEGKGSCFSFKILHQTSKIERQSSGVGKNQSPLLAKMKNSSYSRFLDATPGAKQGSIHELKSAVSTESPVRKLSVETPEIDRSKMLTSPGLQRAGSFGIREGSDHGDDSRSFDSDRMTMMQKYYPPTMPIKNFPKTVGELDSIKHRQPKKKKPCCPMILVVDDDSTNHFAMEQMLKVMGLQHDSAFNGRDAVNKYKLRVATPCKNKCGAYKLIFMDNNMPVKNGIEATLLIRDFEKCNKLSRVVIIGCTAYTDQPVEYYVDFGMDDCIFKPVNFEKLKQTLAKFPIQGLTLI